VHVYSIFSEAVGSSETLAETYKATQYYIQWDHSTDLHCSETSDINLHHTKFVKLELTISYKKYVCHYAD